MLARVLPRMTVALNRLAQPPSLRLPSVLPIRNDFKLAVKSLNEGRPVHRLAPQSKLALDIDAVAIALTRKPGRVKAPKKRGLFSRFRKR